MVEIPVNASSAYTVVDVTSNGQTVFAFDFRIDEVADAKARYTAPNGTITDLSGGVDFTISGLTVVTGGTITLSSLVTAVGGVMTIYRDITVSRATDYIRDFFAADINAEQDRVFMILQDLRRDVNRSVKMQLGDGIGLLISQDLSDGDTLMKSGSNIVKGPNAGNIASAETFAQQAEASKVLSQAWAEGTLPGGVGTKSSKEWAQIAESAVNALQISVTSIAELQALNTANIKVVQITDPKRAGIFVWRMGDYSALVAVDTRNMIVAQATGIAATVGAWVRVYDGVLSLSWAGPTGNAITDDTVSVQAAFNLSGYLRQPLRVPSVSGAYRLTSPITYSNTVKIIGDGVDPGANYGPNEGTNSAGTVTLGPGSWFYIDHTGLGFQGLSTSQCLMGVEFRKIGTFRNQPTPAAGWAPNNHDFDFLSQGVDILYEDIFIHNATRGFKVDVAANGNTYGRPTFRRIFGQPFSIGIQVENCYDVPRFEDVHFWPFWTHNLAVWQYQLTNTAVFDFARVDNGMISKCFSIFHNIFLNVRGNAQGTTAKLKILDSDFDRCRHGIVVNASSNGFTCSIDNCSTQAETGVTVGAALLVNGSNAVIQVGSIKAEEFAQNIFSINGSGNVVTVADAYIKNWDKISAGAAAFSCASGNTLRVYGRILGGTTTGTGALFGGGGTIKYPGLVTTGIAQVTASATSVTFNHGLPIQPTTIDIKINQLSGLGSAGSGWISATTATTATLTVNNAPGAVISFGWRAAIE